jgi:hypothetical protein
MNKAEKNYPITDQECLAVIWAVKHYQHYLGLKPFTLVTDHSALKWLQTSKLPKGRRARWVMELQQYEFEIKHRPGKHNANADALSRRQTISDETLAENFRACIRQPPKIHQTSETAEKRPNLEKSRN